jgi:hypothetical protein
MHYLISGLLVSSEIPLAGVASATQPDTEPDVRVSLSPVSRELPQASLRGPNWMLAEDAFLLRVPDVVRMLVRAGREIAVEIEGSSSEADAIPFLLATGFGALLHQRGALAFHASAVAHEGRAIALCGSSGVGKSTLSAALCQAGCRFISDDISAISFESGHPQVLPDSRQHRLWADAIERLALAERQGAAVRDTIEKYHVAPPCDGAATPLSTIIVLRKAEFRDQQPVFEPLDIADAAALLRGEVYRSTLATRMGRDAELFGQISRLLGHVRVLRLTRPQEIEKLDDVVALVRTHVFGAG